MSDTSNGELFTLAIGENVGAYSINDVVICDGLGSHKGAPSGSAIRTERRVFSLCNVRALTSTQPKRASRNSTKWYGPQSLAHRGNPAKGRRLLEPDHGQAQPLASLGGGPRDSASGS